MLKKIIFGLVISSIIAGGVYWFTYTKELRTPVSDGINAIPNNAAIILECRQSKNSWKKLTQDNVMWKELLGTETFSKLHIQGRYIDSVIKLNASVSQLLDNRSLFISAHVSGATTFDFLYVYSLPNRGQQSSVDGFIKTINNNSEPSMREYAGVDIGTIHPLKKDSLSYAFLNGILMMSSKQNLVEDAIRQLKSGVSLAKDKDLIKVLNTAGKNADANVYINYKNFPSILGHFVSPSIKNDINSFADFADFSGWDASVKSNALTLNGFTQSNDSSTKFLNLFKEQKTQEIEITKVIPSKTALLIWFGISNIKTFQHGYKKYLKAISHVRAESYEQYIEGENAKYSINIERSMLEWIGNEMALVITEPSSNDFADNSFAVIRSNNADDAMNTLNMLADSIKKKEQHVTLPSIHKGKEKQVSTHKIKNLISSAAPIVKKESRLETAYRSHDINYIDLPKLLPKLFGWQFNKITNTYYTSIGDYIVFGNTREALQNFIDGFENNKTLANDKNYKSFAENISLEANVYIYSSIARSTNIYSDFVSDESAKDIENKLVLFHKFEAAGIQFSAGDKLFYSSVYLKYNPKYKQESGTLWESGLDTAVSSRPQLLINHNTKAKEIIVQDDANKLYLISSTGKIIWTKQLPEKIIGEIIQVDVLKNNKLQILFNTHNAIYLYDRTGKEMKGFPIILESPAVNAVSVVDYEKNQDYRIFAACENKKILCFKSNGEAVKAFNFNKTDNLVYLPIQYIKIENKDLLCAVDEKGKIYVLNRQGEASIKIIEKLPHGIRSFFIESGKSFSKSYIIAADTSGNIIKISFSGIKEIIKTGDFETAPFFEYKDINNDKIKEYIFLSRNELKVFSENKPVVSSSGNVNDNKADEHNVSTSEPSLLFSYEFKENIQQAPMFFLFPDGIGKIGVLSEKTNELFLFNDNGTVYKGFPLEGKIPFSIGDMNNEGVYNIITGSDKTIYLYQLE